MSFPAKKYNEVTPGVHDVPGWYTCQMCGYTQKTGTACKCKSVPLKEWYYLIVCWDTCPQDIRIYTGTVKADVHMNANKELQKKFSHIRLWIYDPSEDYEKYDGQCYVYTLQEIHYIEDETIVVSVEGAVDVSRFK